MDITIYNTDKGTTHSYIEEYERLFKGLNNITLLEIGTNCGSSLEMWRDWFPNSEIYGIDINPKGYPEGVKVIKGDATKELILNNFKDIKFDVIIDDGSHRLEDQLKSLELFFPIVKDGGMYIIEDIQNIDADRDKFKGEIIDKRSVKNRYDDVLVIYIK
jgi:23S rRNA U2552 (ribose-2'-O)-methylase RlmE/FtsJ